MPTSTLACTADVRLGTASLSSSWEQQASSDAVSKFQDVVLVLGISPAVQDLQNAHLHPGLHGRSPLKNSTLDQTQCLFVYTR